MKGIFCIFSILSIFTTLNPLESVNRHSGFSEEVLSRSTKKEIRNSLFLTLLTETQERHDEEIRAYSSKESLILSFTIVSLILATTLGILFYKNRLRVEANKVILSRIKQDQVIEISTALDKVMLDKPYLDPDLSLFRLADQITTSDKNLSCFFNQHLETSFYDYLNKARLNEFIDRIKSGEYQNYSLSGIALDCGFKSKSSFYRAFKKEKHLSPKEYIEFLKLADHPQK